MKRPNLHDLANLAQVVSAMGVIVSLIYVAVEIRQNTNAIRAGTFQQMAIMTTQLRSELVSDSSFASLAVKANADPGSLSPGETLRMESWIAAVFRQFENLYYQHQAGMLDSQLWKGYDHLIRHSMGNPALLNWFAIHRDEYSDNFVSYINSITGGVSGMP